MGKELWIHQIQICYRCGFNKDEVWVGDKRLKVNKARFGMDDQQGI